MRVAGPHKNAVLKSPPVTRRFHDHSPEEGASEPFLKTEPSPPTNDLSREDSSEKSHSFSFLHRVTYRWQPNPLFPQFNRNTTQTVDCELLHCVITDLEGIQKYGGLQKLCALKLGTVHPQREGTVLTF